MRAALLALVLAVVLALSALNLALGAGWLIALAGIGAARRSTSVGTVRRSSSCSAARRLASVRRASGAGLAVLAVRRRSQSSSSCS